MKHDTNYYGYDIVNLINKTLAATPSLDRGGTYIWVDYNGSRLIFCDLKENDYRGCLEVHEDGYFKDQFDCNGILTWNEDDTDYYFTNERKQKIIYFLEKYKYN